MLEKDEVSCFLYLGVGSANLDKMIWNRIASGGCSGVSVMRCQGHEPVRHEFGREKGVSTRQTGCLYAVEILCALTVLL